MDWSNLIVTALGFLATVFTVYMQNRKSQALIEYRIAQLEKKQDAHNAMIERTYKLEKSVAVLETQVNDHLTERGA